MSEFSAPESRDTTEEPEKVDAIEQLLAPAEPTGAERRKAIRKTLRGKAYLLFPKRDPIQVRTLDLSCTGLCVVVPLNPPLKLHCGVRFSIPTKPQGAVIAETQSTVIYSVFSSDENGFKVGLQFNSPSGAVIKAINQFIGG